MAQKRMLDKKISFSEKVASLDLLGQLLYTWMIPHADDLGLLQSGARTIKAQVIPMVDCTAEEVGIQLETMWKTGLLERVRIDGAEYFKIVGSENNQTLKRDRNPQTILPIKMAESFIQSWEMVDKIIVDAERITFGIQMDPIGSGRELKRTEEKILNNGAEAPTLKYEKKNDESLAPSTNPLKAIMDRKAKEISKEVDAKHGIHTAWQEKAFRYADKLGLVLAPKARGRWLKCFKQASEGRKTDNLEKAYSFIIDYPKALSNEQKMMFFFKIYERGLDWMKETNYA